MKKISRRTFLGETVKSTLGLLTISVIPLSLAACNDDTVDMTAMANLGPLEELKKGPFPKKVNYQVKIKDGWEEQEREGFVYVNIKNDELLIMSPICTHLGCTATTPEESKQKDEITYFCPCHGWEYDEYGINIGGPPPRPLDIFKPYLVEGNVYIPILSATVRKI